MLALQTKLLRTDEVFFCTSQLNNKPPGYKGGGWHSHPMGGGFDYQGTCSPDEYMRGSVCSLTLAYPEGFAHGADGNINVVVRATVRAAARIEC